MKATLLALAFLIAGCGLAGPEPECQTGMEHQTAVLTCGVAVTAARAELSVDHPPITRIQFLYGSTEPCCSRLVRADEIAPLQAYVVFTYSTGARESVDLAALPHELITGNPKDY